MPEDAAYEAKQPYAETFEEHDVVIEPDDSPEFISHAIGELLSNEHRARAPSLRQLTRAKTIMQTDQYPVEQRIETREIVKTAIPNVALPGSNQSPEIDNESITHIDRPETAFVSQAIGHLSASPERVMTFPSLRVQLSRVTSERQLTAMLTKSMIAHTRDVPARALPGLPVMKTFAREIPQDVKEVPASPIHESPPTPFPISRHQEQQEESVARDEVKMRMVPKRDVAEKPFLLSPQSQETLTSRKPTKHEPQQAVVTVVKPIVSDPISKRSLKVPVFSQKNIVYADNSLTSVTQPQRPDPVIAPTPTPAPLVTVKRPKSRRSLPSKMMRFMEPRHKKP
ncbi:hypothetical protein CSA56_03980 [candidate division KSB3 bacterium]|uniref:Uncharacterized protein n=1 Tax=candidate division KSB3 bacterium TaxID=2044937 RepID=A0A2G6KIL6_9BACT|nr:MAG: hypothetical protein CSA56_03980 [candidate division KSB3 bacterium]